MKNWLIASSAAWGSLVLISNALCQNTPTSPTAVRHFLPGHAPAPAVLARPLGRLPETNSLRLAISLPLRHPQALAGLLQRLYDPASPDYRHFLTPAQFAEGFGPTARDYQTVINFAQAKGLAIDSTHESRMLVDVRGNVSDIEGAFHVTLRTYQHPTEARNFYAPDGAPWVDANLPILNVAGLSDYPLLRRAQHSRPQDAPSGTAGGSGPGGYYMGQDFRNAYAPGVALQGTGQMVGLFEADGYYASDIATYEDVAGLAPVPLQNVLVDSFSGAPGSGNGEVAIDIETAISMAPGLTAVVVFEGPNYVSDWLDILDRMASSNQIKQFSSSWGYIGGSDPNTSFDASFQQMAAQGQSFFQASGDGDAWVTPIWVPADSPYVTSVGGTSLTMSGFGGAYSSETVWNSGNLGTADTWFAGGNGYWGSGGGVSTVYSIPSWQQGVSMVANQGSTSLRNIPDVALAAFNIWVSYGNGESGGFIGTSCSAPLWAGFAALANQQAANSNKPPIGFLNPAIYALGQGPNYGLCFNDITSGNNTSSGSPGNYSAVPGYDLCTGWGTPAGSNLINALAGIYQPSITTQPSSQSQPVGGSATFSVTATGVAPLSYQWQCNGINVSGATLASLVVNNLTEANAGTYTVVVANQWGSLTSSAATLTVSKAMPVVSWANPASITYGAALTSSQLNATANVPGTFAYTPASGTVLKSGTQTLSVVFTPTDTSDYNSASATVSLVVSPAPLTVTANNRTKTYGQTVSFAGTEFATSGLISGDTVTSVTLASSGSAATAVVAGSPYNILPSAAGGTGLTNYTVTYANGTLTVSAAALTVTATNRGKTYGQTVTFAGTEFATSGLLNSDTVTSTTITSSGAAATATVAGSPYTIIPSAATGTGLSNYTVTYANGTLAVSAAALTVTATNRSKIYGQTVTFAGTEFATSGLLNSDTVTSTTITSSGAAAAATVAGSPYTIIPSAATGTGLGNYTIAYANGSLTVNAATLTVTATNRGKTYGQTVTFAGTEFTTSGLLNSDTVTSATITSAGAVATATVAGSPYSIIPSAATGTGLGNYTIAYVNGSLAVSAAALTVTATNRGKTYGQTVTFAGTEFTTSGLLNSDAVTSATITSLGAAATATVAGSPYTIIPSAAAGTGLGNYTVTYANGMLTVSAAALTVTATNRGKTYGQTVTFAGTEFTTSGLLNSDTVTSATITSAGAAATATVAGSPYTIVPSAAAGTGLGNYTIAYANGTLTVSAAALTVTATNRGKTYGQTVTFAGTEFTTSGLHNSDTVTSATITSAGAAATATVAGSPYTIVPSAAAGTGLGNYTIAYANGTLTVSAAALTVTATNRSKTYGQTVTFAGTEFTTSGLLNSDTVTSATITSSGAAATATVAGSPYTITPSAATGTGLGNYTIAYVNGSLAVSAAALTVTATNRSKTYGQTVTFAGTEFTTSGLHNSDTVTSASLSCSGAAATATVAGSPYSIVLSAAVGSGLGNYTIAYASGLLTVSPAVLTVTANNRSKTYGQTVTFAGTEFTSSGLFNSDTVSSVSLNSAGAAASATVTGSPYPIIPSAAVGAGLGNYTIAYANGILTVAEAAPAIIWANPAPIIYGAALTSSQLDATTTVPGSFAYSPGNGSVLSAGTNTLSAIFTPSDTADYSSATNTVSLVVLPAPLTVTASSFSRPYETANPVFTGTIAGLTNNDNITAAYSCSATVNSPVGSYPIVPSLVDPNDRETNYSVSLVNGILLVGHPAEVLTWTNPAPIAYGAALASSQLDATATVPGSFAYTPTNGSVLNTGSNALTVIFTPADTVDYTSVTDTVSLVVLPAPLTVTAANTNRTYGQANPPFTTILMGVTNGDTITATASCGATSSSAVGAYPIVPGTPVGNDLTNYTITYASGVLTINPAALTITANNRSKTYGQAVTLAGTEFATSGLLNSDTVSGATLNSSGAAATATVAGSPYSIVLGGAVGSGLGNYTITYASGLLTVSPAVLTVTANNRSKTYGQTVTFAGTEFTSSGLFNSDTVSSVSLNSAGAAASATVTGSPYPIIPSAAVGAGLGNYTIAYANGILTVAEAAPAIIWANPAPIIYGAALTSSQLDATTTVPGSFAYSPGNGSVLSAGTNTLSAIFTPSDTADYSSATNTVSLVVSNAALTVTAASLSRPYGAANPVLTGTISGVTNGDNITAAYSTAATSSSPPGTYSIAPSLVDPNDRETNYTVRLVDGTLTVGQATPALVWTNPVSILYGTALASSQLNATANAGGSFAYSPGIGAVLNTGTNLLSVIFTPTDTVDYSSAGATVSLVVLPAPLTVTASSFSRPYETANPVFTGTIAGLTNNDNITAAYSCSATVNSPVGSYPIVPSLVDPNDRETNYSVSLVNGILLVGHPAEVLTWTNPAPIAYGAALASSQLDATATVPGSFAYTPTNGSVLNTGSNALTVIFTPADTVDYTSVTDTVSLVVLPAPLTVTAANTNRTYGQANPPFTTILMGVTNGDTITATASCGATSSSAVGAYPIVPGTPVGNDLTNYTITYASGVLTINPAALTITANNRSKTYGQAVTLAGTEFATSGLLNSDTVSGATLNSSGAAATATVAGSPYSIVLGGAVGSGLGNYTITYASGLLTVNPATLTVTANNRGKTYGQGVTFAGTEFTTSGLLNSDTVSSATLTSSGALATAAVAGSPYTIVPSAAVGTGLGNYTISYASGALTISPAALTVTANNRSKTYGQTVSFAGTEFTASGLLNSDTMTSATLTSSGAAASATVAGSPYSIVPSAAVGTGLGNYTITCVNGALTITPAALAITADNRSKNFGQTVTFAGTEFVANGLLDGDTVTSVTLTSAGAAATATVADSPYPIIPGAAVGTGLGNYTLAYVNGVLTVTSNATIPPVIQSVQQSGNSVVFTWSTTADLAYQVQYTTNLNQSVWANLGSPITAIGSTATASDYLTNAQTFYRIVALP